MRIYGLKMFNFMRFGESGNSLVFDLTEEQKTKVNSKETDFDTLYSQIAKNPLKYVAEVENNDSNVMDGIVGIAGSTSGSFDSSNGSGKSTIFEAISYLMYERVVRQTANTTKTANAGLAVVTKLSGKYPKDLQESYVEAFFEEDDRIYRLKRGRSFAKNQKTSSPIFEFEVHTVNGVDKLSSHRKDDTKDSLEDIIVEDYDIFVNTVMFGQNDAGKFLVGTDKIKKDMIIELLKLEDVVHGCMDVIREKKKVESKNLIKLQASSDSLKVLIINESKKIEDWEENEETEYGDELIDAVIHMFSEEMAENESVKKKTSEIITGIDDEIKKIESSDSIKKVADLTASGKTLFRDREELESQKEKDLADWKKLLKDSKVQQEASVKDYSSSEDRMVKNVKRSGELSKVIELFNEADHVARIEKCFVAEKAEAGYLEKRKAIKEKREATFLVFSEFSVTSNILTKELVGLEAQIVDAGENDQFLCRECHSMVTKDHTLKKIADIKGVIKQNVEGEEKIDERLKMIDKASATVEERLEKIAKYKLVHQQLISKKKDFDNAKENLVQTKEQVAESSLARSKAKKLIEGLKVKIIEYTKKCASIEKTHSTKIEELKSKIEEIKKEIRELGVQNAGLKVQIQNLNVDKLNHSKSIESLNKKNGSLQEKIDQVIDLGRQISEEDKEIEVVRKQLQRWAILERAFGLDGVQTRIVDKHLPLLNMYIKEYMDTLSNGKLEVDLFINDKSKVDMKIVGGTAESYIMLSGGEKMIVRLAVDVGLSLLSFSRTSKAPDMICLDEIFGPLDKDSTKSVFSMLSALKKRFNRVFLISHKSEIQSLVENNIIVEKSSGTQGLSRIVGIRDISL